MKTKKLGLALLLALPVLAISACTKETKTGIITNKWLGQSCYTYGTGYNYGNNNQFTSYNGSTSCKITYNFTLQYCWGTETVYGDYEVNVTDYNIYDIGDEYIFTAWFTKNGTI